MAQEWMSKVFASSRLQSGHKIESGDMSGLFPCPVVAASSSGRELLHVCIYIFQRLGGTDSTVQCFVEAECLKALVLAHFISYQGNDG